MKDTKSKLVSTLFRTTRVFGRFGSTKTVTTNTLIETIEVSANTSFRFGGIKGITICILFWFGGIEGVITSILLGIFGISRRFRDIKKFCQDSI